MYNININKFLQYLWGIETNEEDNPSKIKKNVFTVPMRNWNVQILDLLLPVLECFYSTYEELKPMK